MFKRLGVSACAVAIVGLAGGSVGPALGSAGNVASGQQRTVRVLEITTEQQFVDVGAKGISVGDYFVFGSKLMKDGKQVGHDGGVCTVTSVDNQTFQCQATSWIDDAGQITVQGLVSAGPSTFTLPITGGSGAYVGAEGELRVRELSQTRSILTFHLSD